MPQTSRAVSKTQLTILGTDGRIHKRVEALGSQPQIVQLQFQLSQHSEELNSGKSKTIKTRGNKREKTEANG
jgi:hypothetical protein